MTRTSKPRRSGVRRVLVAVIAATAACSSTPGAPGSTGAVTSTSNAVDQGAPTSSSTSRQTPTTRSNRTARPPAPPSPEPGFAYQWTRLPTGPGGWVTGLVVHPKVADVMYARTDTGGAYRWNAKERYWEQMVLTTTVANRKGGDDYHVESIAVSATDPNKVWMSVGNDATPDDDSKLVSTGRVLYSGDGGRSWQVAQPQLHIAANNNYRQRSERLVADPANDSRLLLGTREQGLWASDDGGKNWRQIPLSQLPKGKRPEPGKQVAGVMFVTFDPSSTSGGRTLRAFAGVQGEGVFTTEDGGQTWRKISSVDDAITIPSEGSVVDGRLFVAFNPADGSKPSRLRAYDIKTAAWTDLHPPTKTEVLAWAIDPTESKRMVAAAEGATSGQMWLSTNGGQSWQTLKVSNETPDYPWVNKANNGSFMSVGRFVFDPHKSGRLWFAEGTGVWHATNLERGTAHFVLESDGINELHATEMITPPGGVPVSAVGDYQGFYHSDLKAVPAKVLTTDEFAGGTDLDYSGKNPQNLVWAGALYNLYWSPQYYKPRGAVSKDGGKTWTELPNLGRDHFGGNVAMSATDPNNIVWVPSYFINLWEHTGKPKGIFITKDGGKTWTNLPDVGGSNSFHRLIWWFNRQALVSDKVEGATFYLFDDTKQFFVSRDGGTSWQKAPFSPPCEFNNACMVNGALKASPVNAREVWAAVNVGGLYRTRDGGQSAWEKIPGVQSVTTFGFGAPLKGKSDVTIYLHGLANGDREPGIYRSSDDGRSWQLIGRFPLDLYAAVTVVSGDLNVPGRIFIGYAGNGFVIGDDPEQR